jgi:predicted transposase YbfD/YdcC
VALTNTPELFTHFADLRDPRTGNAQRHNLLDMIVVALCATICGAESWADVERFGKSKQDWFLGFLRLEQGIPSHDTFGRVFARLDTEEFFACLQRWIASLQLPLSGRAVAIDGKTLRRSFDNATGKSALQLVSAWAGELRLSLGQVAVDDHSNEIPAVAKLLELLDLEGAVVTLDAMHCQKETIAKIHQRGADYVVRVKANQPALHDQLQQLFIAYGEDDYHAVRRCARTERRRGRVERREYYVARAPRELTASGQWKDVRSVGMVYRHREHAVQQSDEVTFFISSLPPKVRALAQHVRGHWGIENSLHWVLDVTFSEDASRIRKGKGQEIAAAFRRLALSILQRDTTLKENTRGKRLRAGWENRVLEGILTAKSR